MDRNSKGSASATAGEGADPIHGWHFLFPPPGAVVGETVHVRCASRGPSMPGRSGAAVHLELNGAAVQGSYCGPAASYTHRLPSLSPGAHLLDLVRVDAGQRKLLARARFEVADIRVVIEVPWMSETIRGPHVHVLGKIRVAGRAENENLFSTLQHGVPHRLGLRRIHTAWSSRVPHLLVTQGFHIS